MIRARDPAAGPADLERRVRALARNQRLLAVLLLAACSGALAAAARQSVPTVIDAQRFRMVDEFGEVRAELTLNDEGEAGLFIHDEYGVLRAKAIHDGDQTGLFVLDEEGTIRLGAARSKHGGGGFLLHGPKAKGAVVLALEPEAGGSLTFSDAAGTVVARLPDAPAKAAAGDH